MLLQCCKLDDPQFPEIWILRFKDQRGNPVREIVGPSQTEAKALLRRRRDEVRGGTYLSPEGLMKLHEQRWGRCFSEFLRDFAIAVEFGPQNLDDWLASADRFGYEEYREPSTPLPPDFEDRMLAKLAPPPLPPPTQIAMQPRFGRTGSRTVQLPGRTDSQEG